MADQNSTRRIGALPIPEDDGFPRMVTLLRNGAELSAVGASDAEDASRQVAIMVLKLEGGLQIGDMIQITRI